MLPGFRFLFAAIALSISILVFSLGAAALLRAAHQEFASMPRHIAAETVFAQPNEGGPALAMLRADPAEASVSEPAKADETEIPGSAAEPSDPASPGRDSPLPEGEKIAERDNAAMPAEVDTPAAELSASAETSTETPAPVKTEVAAVEETTPVASAPSTVAAPVQAVAATDDRTRMATPRIAALGGPAVNISSPAKLEQRRAPKKRSAAAVKKSAPKQHAAIQPTLAPRPRIQHPVSRRPAAPSATPFGAWDNGWPGSGPAGKSALPF
jgi:hypothetical protein